MAKKKPSKISGPTAKETAEAMAENMAANQADPNFEIDKANREKEAAATALKNHAKNLEKSGIKKP